MSMNWVALISLVHVFGKPIYNACPGNESTTGSYSHSLTRRSSIQRYAFRMARPIARGVISFGPVSIPVGLFGHRRPQYSLSPAAQKVRLVRAQSCSKVRLCCQFQAVNSFLLCPCHFLHRHLTWFISFYGISGKAAVSF